MRAVSLTGKFSVDLIDAVQNGRSEGARRRRAATAARRMVARRHVEARVKDLANREL